MKKKEKRRHFWHLFPLNSTERIQSLNHSFNELSSSMSSTSSLKVNSYSLKAYRVPVHQELDEKAKALFYSNWYFSGIRLLTSIEEQNNIKTIAETLRLPVTRVREVVEFLLAHGLCVEKENQLQMGPRRTHVDASSPLV